MKFMSHAICITFGAVVGKNLKQKWVFFFLAVLKLTVKKCRASCKNLSNNII